MLEANAGFYFPYTPATNLLRGLQEALAMLDEEGLPNVFARHDRHGAATRAAVQAWGQAGAVELQCLEPTDYSSSLTAVRLAEGHSADALRALILRRFNMSLGNGLGILKDRVFRIGHLGDINDLTLLGALSGVEMGLKLAGVPIGDGGVDAAMAVLAAEKGTEAKAPAGGRGNLHFARPKSQTMSCHSRNDVLCLFSREGCLEGRFERA